MTDRDDTESAGTLRGPRHAAPRVSVRSRIRGRAMAIAAVPTALIVGAAYSPTPLAVADTQADKTCASAPDTVLGETPVPKSEIGVQPAPSATATAKPTRTVTRTVTPTATPTGTPVATASTKVKLPVPSATAKPAEAAPNAAAEPAAPSGTTEPEPSATATATAAADPHGIIGDILDGILDPGGRSPSPTPSSAPATHGPTARPSDTPAPAATPASGAAASQASTSAAPAASTGAATADASPTSSPSPSPSSSPSGADSGCMVDARSVDAEAAPAEDVVPDQSWTLRSSKLALHGSVFNGVYDVRTPTGTKRVLKFTTASVDIGDLDMSTVMSKDHSFHVKGAPGSTSTMRNGPVTMYVESLSGHLSAVYGLPVPVDLGEITLTPDTLPKWLWDLIGAVPLPLDITLDDAEAVQAGQFGGTLKIPGMNLYQDETPY